MPKKTGKEALLEWCKQRCSVYQIRITDFHLCWRDGLGFCALLAYFCPEELDFPAAQRLEPLKRLELAFDTGDDLGIANILDPEDMFISPRPDEMSVITYLSQFYHRFKGQARGRGGAGKPPVPSQDDKLAALPCPACGNNLAGDVIQAFGDTFHLKCFKCSGCSAPLGKKFVDVDNKAYCDVCGKAAFVNSVSSGGKVDLGADSSEIQGKVAAERKRIAEQEALANEKLAKQRQALAAEREKLARQEQQVVSSIQQQREVIANKKRERLETLGHSDAPRLHSLRKPKMQGRRAPTPAGRSGGAVATKDASAAAGKKAGPAGAVAMPGMGGGVSAIAAAAAAKRAGAEERARLEQEKRRELDAARAERERKAAAERAARDAEARAEVARLQQESRAKTDREAAAAAREEAALEAEREANELAASMQRSAEERKKAQAEAAERRKAAAEARKRERERAQEEARRREEEAIAKRRAELEARQRAAEEQRRQEEARIRQQEEEKMARELDIAEARASQAVISAPVAASGADEYDGVDLSTLPAWKRKKIENQRALAGYGAGSAPAAPAAAKPAVPAAAKPAAPAGTAKIAGKRQPDGSILLPNGVMLPNLPGAGTVVVALFDYMQAQDDGELTFKAGDEVIVIERGDDGAWWSGVRGEKVGLFPSNYFTLGGKRICGPEDLDLSDDDDAVNALNDEFEQEERMLAEMERKKLDELAAERAKRHEELLKAELEAEREAEAERQRLARERDELIHRMEDDYAQKARTRTRTNTESRLQALGADQQKSIDEQYQAKVGEAAERAAALEGGRAVGKVRTMTIMGGTSDVVSSVRDGDDESNDGHGDTLAQAAAAAGVQQLPKDVILLGWLAKRDGRGVVRKAWRKRFCLLRGSQLFFYQNEKVLNYPPLGSVALEFVDMVKIVGQKQFKLASETEKTYFLEAPSARMATKWVVTLNKALEDAKNQSTRGTTVEMEGEGAAQWSRKDGWLKLHGTGMMSKQWSKVWVVARAGFLVMFSKPGKKQLDKISLNNCELAAFKLDKYSGCAFQIKTKRKNKEIAMEFLADTEEEMQAWSNFLIRQKLSLEMSLDSITLD